MGAINWPRVFLGGFVSGVVINAVGLVEVLVATPLGAWLYRE
jgi:hypothetical protein